MQAERFSTPDFWVENHFSIYLLRPLTDAAKTWCEEHLPQERTTWGEATVVEHRYIGDIVEGIKADGLVIA